MTKTDAIKSLNAILEVIEQYLPICEQHEIPPPRDWYIPCLEYTKLK